MKGHMTERRPGVWLVRIDVGADPVTGKRRQVARVVHGKAKDARTALKTLAEQTARPARRGAVRPTFNELVDRWLAHADGRLAPSTLREYRRLLDRTVRPRFGRTRLDQLAADDLDEFYDALITRGLSPRSVRQIHSVIRRALVHGVRWGWARSNPAVQAEPPPVRRARRQSMTADQIVKALIAADEVAPEFGVYCRVVAATGARRGEVCALRLGDLDLDAPSIAIDRSITTAGGRVEKDTKTHAGRTVSIDAGTSRALRAHIARLQELAAEAGAPWLEDRFVFSDRFDGARPWHPDTPSHWWADVRTKAGLPAWARLHDLRHAHATLLLDAGVPLPAVSERLGHADAHTTLTIYAHAVKKRDSEAADTIGELLDGSSRRARQ